MAKGTGCHHRCKQLLLEVHREALKQFNAVKELYPNQTFWQWAATNYPSLATTDRMRKSAQTKFYQAMQLFQGPHAVVLSTYMDNIMNAQGSNTLAGYSVTTSLFTVNRFCLPVASTAKLNIFWVSRIYIDYLIIL